MLYREILAVCFQVNTKSETTLFVENEEVVYKTWRDKDFSPVYS